MKEEQKQDRRFWILAKTSYAGTHGIYHAGRPYEVYQSNLDAITAEINQRRAATPKQQRRNVVDFKYTETPAPWDAYKDPDRIALSEAQDKLNSVQAELNQCRSRQEGLINRKNEFSRSLSEYLKLDNKELEKPGIINRVYRKQKANFEIIEVDLEQVVEDIKEHAAAANSLVNQINDLRQAIADKETSASETDDENPQRQDGDSKADDAPKKNESGETEGNDNPQGQTV